MTQVDIEPSSIDRSVADTFGERAFRVVLLSAGSIAAGRETIEPTGSELEEAMNEMLGRADSVDTPYLQPREEHRRVILIEPDK